MFLKNFVKLTGAIYAGVSFSIKLKVVGWKETLAHMHSYEFCEIFKKDCLLVNWRFWYLGIYLRRDILFQVHIDEMHSFLQHFGIPLFQIDFRVFHNLRGVFRTILNIYDSERSITDIWQGFKTSLQPRFLTFSNFLTLFVSMFE